MLGEEGGNPIAPRVPGRHRRHRPRCVLDEQLEDGVDIGPLEGVHVAADERARPLVAECAKRRLLALRGQPLVDRPARALQRAVHRRDRQLEQRGGLGGGEPEHLAQDQHRALARRQMLERRDERELEALPQLVAGLRSSGPVGHAELPIGIRLDPHRLGERPAGSLARVRRWERRPAGARASAGAWRRPRTRSSRSGRASFAASCGPRTARVRATRAGACPAARPRRRGPSRASGSSGRGARPGAARPGAGRRPRRRRARPRGVLAPRESRLPCLIDRRRR